VPASYLYDPIDDAARLTLQAADTALQVEGLLGPVLGRLAARAGAALRVLDAGCAQGCLTELLFGELPAGSRLVGMDINAGALEEAQTRLGGATFVCSNISDAHQHDLGLFDLVFSSMVLQHLDGPDDGVRQLWEMVAPGGVLFVLWPDDRFLLPVPTSDELDSLVQIGLLPGVSNRRATEQIAGAALALGGARIEIGVTPWRSSGVDEVDISFSWRIKRARDNGVSNIEALVKAVGEFRAKAGTGQAAILGATPYACVTKGHS
jgi:SAM-dependent methyltransferase